MLNETFSNIVQYQKLTFLIPFIIFSLVASKKKNVRKHLDSRATIALRLILAICFISILIEGGGAQVDFQSYFWIFANIFTQPIFMPFLLLLLPAVQIMTNWTPLTNLRLAVAESRTKILWFFNSIFLFTQWFSWFTCSLLTKLVICFTFSAFTFMFALGSSL